MANNPFGSSFEDTFEQGISQVKQQTKQQVTTTAQAIGTQIGVQPTVDQGGQIDSKQGVTDQFNETGTSTTDPQQQQLQIQQAEAKDQAERQEKLADTRQKLQQHQALHKKTYYDPTFVNRPKEPSVQERLQQEEQEEEQKKMEELQEEKKKEMPVALQRAKTGIEMNRGASG